MRASCNDLDTQADSNIISFAEYRARRFGQADGDVPPPPPGALGARPFTLTARVEADAGRHAARARAFTYGQLTERRMCHATPA